MQQGPILSQYGISPAIIESTNRGERVMDIFTRLLKDRIVFLGTPVTDEVANIICGQLLFLDSENSKQDITLYINSPGGVVTAGMAIYDTMNYVRAPVATLCLGQACSMGALLLTAGAKGKRYSLPSSTIMIHQPLGGARGQATDILIQAKEIQRHKDRLNNIMAACTGKPIEQVTQDTERDNFMDAQQALEYGLIDAITERLPTRAARDE